MSPTTIVRLIGSPSASLGAEIGEVDLGDERQARPDRACMRVSEINSTPSKRN